MRRADQNPNQKIRRIPRGPPEDRIRGCQNLHIILCAKVCVALFRLNILTYLALTNSFVYIYISFLFLTSNM